MAENMSAFGKRPITSCGESDSVLRRGPWTLEEDTLLIQFIASHGEGRWNLLAKRSGLKRTGKSCRLRWLNYLKPDVKRGNFTAEEQISILQLHFKWGNRWSKIAKHLPGRTDNEIKNYWRTHIQKQARRLMIDANSIALRNGSSSLSSQNLIVLDQGFDYAFQNNSAAQSLMPYQGLIDLQKLNSSSESEHGISHTRIISSSESMNFSEISEFSNYPSEYNTFAKDLCQFDNNCYDMKTINEQPETVPALMTGDFNKWVLEYDVEENMWNGDELLQFKNSKEQSVF